MLRCGGTRCIRTFASDARLKQHRAKCDGWLNAQNLQKERSVALSRGKVQSTGKTIVLPSQHVMVSMDVRSHEQQAEATNKNISNKRRRLDSNPLVPHKFTQQMASVTKPIIEEYNLEPKEVQDTFIDSEVGGQTSVEENIASEPSSPNPKGDQVSKEVDNIYSSDNFDLPEQAHENEVDVSQRGNHGEDQVVTPPANRLPTLNHSADGSESQSRVPLHDIQPASNLPRILLYIREVVETTTDAFGIFHQYYTKPSDTPQPPPLPTPTHDRLNHDDPTDTMTGFGVCQNASRFLLQYWFWMFGSRMTNETRGSLAEMVNSPHFKAADVAGVNWRDLDESLAQPTATNDKDKLRRNDDFDRRYKEGAWAKKNVDIFLPFKDRKTFDPNRQLQNDTLPRDNLFTVESLHVRSIAHLIRNLAKTESHSRGWIWEAHKEYWRTQENGETREQRIYSEVTSSDAFIRAEEDLRRTASPNGCKLPKAVVSIMVWSDSTHLGDFTDASLHPVYIGVGNESKYRRGEPTARAVHPVALLPKLGDNLHDFLVKKGVVKGANANMMSHCRRELMHAAWNILLDDDFVDGYKNGWVVPCQDGIVRRIFPRIFTYSADYPEKVMLACIRDNGDFPCPRCYVAKDDLDQVGLVHDYKTRQEARRFYTDAIDRLIRAARSALYGGASFLSKKVEYALKSKSLRPTINAFAKRLGSLGLDHYRMLVIDFMHEFELGVWKSLVHHIVRILYTCGDESVRIFDQRLRETPTFGRDIIRKIRNNASLFKKFTARDYEDLLQARLFIVIIPAIEGLLPPVANAQVIGLLYFLATYHALGKLRLHTDDTLSHWQNVCVTVGNLMRQFRDDICPQFLTKETPREAQARARRSSKSNQGPVNSARTPKGFNINTYKYHAIGDGPSTVREFGTTDSYSTWIGELLHKRPKAHYSRTAKNHTSTRGVTEIDSRMEQLVRLALHNQDALPPSFLRPLRNVPQAPPKTEEATPLNNRYHIAETSKSYFTILAWLGENRGSFSAATSKFRAKLENHLLSRIIHEQDHRNFPSFDEVKRQKLRIKNDRIYTHKRVWIHFTSYDVRRDRDVINLASGKQDVMFTSSDTNHPFAYARVMGIFHVDAEYPSVPLKRYNLLWVRWFAAVPADPSSQGYNPLDKLGIQKDEDFCYGFADPANVVRACHLIPAWHHGTIRNDFDCPPESGASNTCTYRYYYINKFVDRDMFMRYLGGGIGHKGGGAQIRFQGNTDLSWAEDAGLVLPVVAKDSQTLPEEDVESRTMEGEEADSNAEEPVSSEVDDDADSTDSEDDSDSTDSDESGASSYHPDSDGEVIDY